MNLMATEDSSVGIISTWVDEQLFITITLHHDDLGERSTHFALDEYAIINLIDYLQARLEIRGH